MKYKYIKNNSSGVLANCDIGIHNKNKIDNDQQSTVTTDEKKMNINNAVVVFFIDSSMATRLLLFTKTTRKTAVVGQMEKKEKEEEVVGPSISGSSYHATDGVTPYCNSVIGSVVVTSAQQQQ